MKSRAWRALETIAIIAMIAVAGGASLRAF
jgi:hypothetical protein